MPLEIQTLQTFFQAKFHFFDRSFGELTHFDGAAYWHVLYHTTSHLMKISAGPEPLPGSIPTVEIEGSYSESSVSLLTGGDVMLVLRPHDVSDPRNYVAITKTKSGRLSLATTVGFARPT